jgi:hypothetical protein
LVLLQRCITDTQHNGETCNVADLPQKVIETLATTLEKIDPQDNIQLEMTCPACGQLMLTTFDIATFLWHEIEAHARLLLLEVHALAKAYGWREQDILAMSSWRRRKYLELVYG